MFCDLLPLWSGWVHVLDVGLSCARFHAAIIVSQTASVVEDLVQIGLDDLSL